MSKKYGECGKHPGQNMVNCVYCGMEKDNKEIEKLKNLLLSKQEESKPVFNNGECKVNCNCIQIAEYENGGNPVKSYPCLKGVEKTPQQNAEEYMKSIGIEVDKIKGLLIPITIKENESEISLIELMENYAQSVGVSEEEKCKTIILNKIEELKVKNTNSIKHFSNSKHLGREEIIAITKHLNEGFENDQRLLQEIIQSLSTQPQPKGEEKWISVNDELPERGIEVLTTTKDGWMRIISTGVSKSIFPSQVTHWRRLPKLPIEPKEEDI
jgi:hypothetical protein